MFESGKTSLLDNQNLLQACGSQPWDGTSAPAFVEPALLGPAHSTFGAKLLTDSPRQAGQAEPTPPRPDVVPEQVPPSLPSGSTTAAPVQPPKPNEEPLDPLSSAAAAPGKSQPYPAPTIPPVPSATGLPPNAQRLLNLLLSSPSTLRQLNAILGYIAAMNPPSTTVPVDCHYRLPSSAEGSTLNMAFVKYLTDLPRHRQTPAAAAAADAADASKS